MYKGHRPLRGQSKAKVQDLRHRVMRLILLIGLGMIIALIPFIARAAEQTPPGSAATQSAQDVISKQLTAIRTRDADTAYSMMTHDFHENFEDAKNFLSDLRFEHRAIYNHEDFTFLDKQSSSGPVSLQKVRINDHYGIPITVIYRLEQQEDGSWLIDSFTILDAEAQPI